MIYRRKSFFEYLREITVIEWIGGVFVVLLPYIVTGKQIGRAHV